MEKSELDKQPKLGRPDLFSTMNSVLLITNLGMSLSNKRNLQQAKETLGLIPDDLSDLHNRLGSTSSELRELKDMVSKAIGRMPIIFYMFNFPSPADLGYCTTIAERIKSAYAAKTESEYAMVKARLANGDSIIKYVNFKDMSDDGLGNAIHAMLYSKSSIPDESFEIIPMREERTITSFPHQGSSSQSTVSMG